MQCLNNFLFWGPCHESCWGRLQWCIFIDNIQKEVGVEYQELNESYRGVEEKRVVVDVKGREAEG